MFRSRIILFLLLFLLVACTPPATALPPATPTSTATGSIVTPALPDTPTLAPVLPVPSATPLPTSTTLPTATLAATPTATRTPIATPTPVPARAYPFDRVFIVIFENKDAAGTLANPYFKALAARGAYLSNYHAVTHPSEPNYVALIAGATFVTDNGDYNLPHTNLVDLLEGAGRSWKTYQENYPGGCFTGAFAGDPVAGFYARKHNPFISFDSIRTTPARCAKIVKAEQLAADIAADQLPDYSFYTPNQNNDAHDRPLSFAAQWSQGFIEPKLADPRFMRGTLVVVTFDETDADPGGPNGNHVYTLLLGSGVKAGSVDAARYDHYSLLRTVEDAFALGTLGRADATAKPFATCNFAVGCGK